MWKSILSLEQEKLATPSLETCPEDSISSVEEVAPCLCSLWIFPSPDLLPKDVRRNSKHLFRPKPKKRHKQLHFSPKNCIFPQNFSPQKLHFSTSFFPIFFSPKIFFTAPLHRSRLATKTPTFQALRARGHEASPRVMKAAEILGMVGPTSIFEGKDHPKEGLFYHKTRVIWVPGW